MSDKYAKAWEKIKAAARWVRKDEENIGGVAILLFGAALGIYSCINVPWTHEQKKPEKESTTIRQDVSEIWHHAKCALKVCDEDGRCPVWSTEYRKCYMLDKHALEFLKRNEKGLRKEIFEEIFVK